MAKYIIYSPFNVSIVMRKGLDNKVSKHITADILTNTESLRKILYIDEGYKFLRAVR